MPCPCDPLVTAVADGLANLDNALFALVKQCLALGGQLLNESRDLGEPFEVITVCVASGYSRPQTAQVFPRRVFVLLAEPPTCLGQFTEIVQIDAHFKYLQ